MKQLLLALEAEKPPTFDSFVTGQNTELVQFLQLFSQHKTLQTDEHSVYIWGDAGAGKSHLLQALAQQPNARYLTPSSPTDQFTYHPDTQLYVVDDCDQLAVTRQIDAFALFNEVKAHHGFFIAAGNAPPRLLNLREDLRTRLGWGLIYQVHGLNDADKIQALERIAAQRGLTLGVGVLPYLITHYHRDMRSLSSILGQLDQYSLETKRQITLPLLRELLRDLVEQPSTAIQTKPSTLSPL